MIKVDASIGTNEIVDALVHQTIQAMDNKHEGMAREFKAAQREEERLRCEIDELLVSNPPEIVRALVESSLDTGLFGVSFRWQEGGGHHFYDNGHTKPIMTGEGLKHLALKIDAYTTRGNSDFQAIGTIRMNLPVTEVAPACVPSALSEALDAEKNRVGELKKDLYALSERLRRSNLRTELRGELLSKVIASQAPDIHGLFDSLVSAEVTPQIEGKVIEHE